MLRGLFTTCVFVPATAVLGAAEFLDRESPGFRRMGFPPIGAS